jgi:DNA-binding NarL/FixJ family response regulator
MTMLIVEDENMMRQLLKEILQSAYPDSTIAETDSAERAIELCNSLRPPLVVMDVKLPDGNGIELTARIKALLPETSVIVVSQHAAQVYVERAHAAGVIAYITKDKVHQELLPTVASALAGKSVVMRPEPNS